VLSSHLMTIIESTFASGSFLTLLPSSCSTTPEGTLSLTTPAGPMQPSFPYGGPWSQSTLSMALNVVIGSPLFTAVPSLASITARVLPLLTESSPLDGWNTFEMVATHLEQVTSNVENHWAQSALANIENEDDIGMRSLNLVPFTLLKPMLQTPSLAKLPRISGLSSKRSFSPPSCFRSPCFPPSPIPALSPLLYLPSSRRDLSLIHQPTRRCPCRFFVRFPICHL